MKNSICLKSLIFLFLGLFLINCKTGRQGYKSSFENSFKLFKTKDTIHLSVKYFVKNDAHCFTSGIPYALIIGETDKTKSKNIPEVITVLARCDNNQYEIGENLKVLPIKDPRKSTTMNPVYLVRDTIINGEKGRWVIGSENPTIWGEIIQE